MYSPKLGISEERKVVVKVVSDAVYELDFVDRVVAEIAGLNRCFVQKVRRGVYQGSERLAGFPTKILVTKSWLPHLGSMKLYS